MGLHVKKIKNLYIILPFCFLSLVCLAGSNKRTDTLQNVIATLSFSKDPQTLQGIQNILSQNKIVYSPDQFLDEWIKQNADSTAWQKGLPECPKTITIKYSPKNIPLVIHPDPETWNPVSGAGRLHGNSVYELRSVPIGNASTQCTYDREGRLYHSEIPEAGSADYFAPVLNRYLHYIYDVEPYILARALAREEDYYKVRPVK